MDNTHIYLIGFPGTGKYTIAKEICKNPDFKLMDSHLINNPVFSIIEQDGKTPLPQEVWNNVGRIWNVVMDTAVNISPAHYSFVMTNFLHEACPDDKEWFETVRTVAEEKRGSLFIPVHLHCDLEENKRRVIEPMRKEKMKCIDPDMVENWHKNDSIIAIDHPNFLKLDVTDLQPEEAAKAIMDHAESLA